MSNKHKTNPNEEPTTKDEALQFLGVRSKKQAKKLSGQVEYVHVRAGRQVLRIGHFAPTMVVGVNGTATVSDRDGHVAELEAPYVIDEWASDRRRVSEHTIETTTDSTLVLVDWRYRDAVRAGLPALRRYSVRTRNSIEQAAGLLIDLTEGTLELQPTH